jgi:hypothetical protein
MGPMGVLACWCDDVSTAGRKAVLAHSLAPLGGRAAWTFGEPDLGDNEGSHGGSGVHRCCGGSGGGSRKLDSKGGMCGEGDYSCTLTFVSIQVLY